MFLLYWVLTSFSNNPVTMLWCARTVPQSARSVLQVASQYRSGSGTLHHVFRALGVESINAPVRSLKIETCYDANFVVTGGSDVCAYDKNCGTASHDKVGIRATFSFRWYTLLRPIMLVSQLFEVPDLKPRSYFGFNLISLQKSLHLIHRISL